MLLRVAVRRLCANATVSLSNRKAHAKRATLKHSMKGFMGIVPQGIWRIVRKYPSTVLWPLLVLGLVLGLGIWGDIRIARVEENSAKSRASSLALDTAIWFEQQLSVAIAPVQLMSAMVKYNPQYDAVRSLFKGLAPALLEQDPLRAIKQLEFVPNGVIADVYPLIGNNADAEGWDLFNSSDKEGALKTVQDRALTLVGPLEFFEGGRGVIVRDPIFISGVDKDESFGLAQRLNPYCGAPCAYDAATRTLFWGFAAGLISLDRLSHAKESKLRVLEDMGYRYEIRALGVTDTDMSIVAASDQPVSQPVEAPIELPNAQWVVRVSPEAGWQSGSFAGVMAAVVVVAIALSLLLFAALVSRKQHQMLLEALLPQHVIKDLRGTDTSLLGGPRILTAETTADLMLSLLNRLLEGYMPDLRDVVFIRQAIIRGVDLYQPTDLKQHIRNANLDNEVARALMQQLGSNNIAASLYEGSTRLPDGDYRPSRTRQSLAAKSFTSGGQQQQQPQDCSTLSGALALILTPQMPGWRDRGEEASLVDASGSETMLPPARETDAGSFASPRNSTQGTLVRVASLSREGASVAGSGGGGGGALAGAPTAPAVPSAGGAAGGSGAVVISHGCGAAGMELVQEEAEQQQQQQQQLPSEPLQRATGTGRPRRSSLTFRDSVSVVRLRPSCDNAVAFAENGEVLLLPPLTSDTAAAIAAAAAAAAIGGGGDSDGRLTPNSTSTTQDDNTGTFSVIRRLPRRVASAINILGRPRSSQRRGSLVLATNAARPDVVLERRLAMATSAVTAVAGGGGGAAAVGHIRRASVASVPEEPLSCEPSGLTEMGLLGSGTGMGYAEAAAGASGGFGRLVPAAMGGGGGSSSRRSQLGGVSRVVPINRVLGVVAPPPPPLPPPPLPVIEEVERVLARADSWQFDTWRLRDVTNGHPLSALGFYLIHRAGLMPHFSVKPVTLARLLRHIEAGYPDNPYHNATHAADVLQTLHVIIHGAQLHVHYLDHLGLLAAYFAAIVHDYGHPGLTNDFLVATSDPLAVRYNDRSPLENHHAAASFGLLQRPELDALAPLSKLERAAFRKQVIEMVLATDMKQHFSLLSQFNTTHRLASFGHCDTTNADAAASGKGGPNSRNPGGVNSELSDIVVDVDADVKALAPKPLDETERLLSLQLAIKAADLGHLGEELDVHQRWLSGLEEEFFRQGDKERQLGIPISPLFDRAKQGVSKSQVGFYEFVALPLVHALCSAFPGTHPLTRCFLSNYNHWRGAEGQAPVAIPVVDKTAASSPPPLPPPQATATATTGGLPAAAAPDVGAAAK
ncbi:hypothetical protein PLESTF_000283100 [Pleodorina starrii]|nr:hypothetical protein PLESTF_000283100 [Pleodorina starrii]